MFNIIFNFINITIFIIINIIINKKIKKISLLLKKTIDLIWMVKLKIIIIIIIKFEEKYKNFNFF